MIDAFNFARPIIELSILYRSFQKGWMENSLYGKLLVAQYVCIIVSYSIFICFSTSEINVVIIQLMVPTKVQKFIQLIYFI